jgi:hypothetical protein
MQSRRAPSYADVLKTLHRRLNRYDVEKDVRKADPPIKTKNGKLLFDERANALFGSLLDSNLQYLRNSITAVTHSRHILLPVLRRHVTHAEWQVPETVEIAIQDSGKSPIRINSSVNTYLVTPGTYIDTAEKTKDKRNEITFIKYGFGKKLSQDLFEHLQLPIQSFSAVQTENDSCQITLRTAASIIHETFNAAFKPVGQNATYFLGNPTKNVWFDEEATTTSSSEADVYILCKELGDTLQAVYGRLYIQESATKNVCVFTCDKSASLRCQLLGVPNILVDEELFKKDGKIDQEYTYIDMDETNGLKHFCLTHVINTNSLVVSDINKILLMGYYLKRDGTTRIRLDNKTRTTLLRVIQVITEKNNSLMREIHTAKCQAMDPETFRRYVYLFQALPIFNAYQAVPYNTTQKLFLEYKTLHERNAFEAFRRQLLRGGDADMVLQTKEESTPLAEKTLFKYKKDCRTVDYTKPLDPDESYYTDVYLKHAIYTGFIKMYPEKMADELQYLSDDAFAILTYYFDFAGGSVHSTFIEPLLKKFAEDQFGSLSLYEYERMYDVWNRERMGDEYEPPNKEDLDSYLTEYKKRTVSKTRKFRKRPNI